MWNPFKKKKKWIRFYSLSEGVADMNPWVPAKTLKRKWRTEALKKYYGKDSKCPVLKLNRLWNHHQNKMMNGVEDADYDGLFQHAVTCPALTTLFETGWVMTAPADFLIKQDGKGEDFGWLSQVMFDTGGPTYVKAHAKEQTEGMRNLVNPFAPVSDMVIKLELPWRIQAHPDIVFLQIPVPYWDEDRFSVPTGIVDPAYSYEINLQMFWHKIEEGEYLIKAGTPLAVWIPIERKHLSTDTYDVIIESANDEDRRNNKIMDYNRYMRFTEMTTLKERIDNQKKVLELNKNKERFD
tara:strand:+ start:8180 stop:9064 length:885 start_codon:yes stop_codon:yes gene_type:complete